MQDDFDNRMGIPDEELATPDLGDLPGGIEEIDAEVVIVEAVGRPSGAARARSASPRKALPAKKAASAAKKPAKKAAKKAKPARKVAKKAAQKAKSAKKVARKTSKKAARKPARKVGKKK